MSRGSIFMAACYICLVFLLWMCSKRTRQTKNKTISSSLSGCIAHMEPAAWRKPISFSLLSSCLPFLYFILSLSKYIVTRETVSEQWGKGAEASPALRSWTCSHLLSAFLPSWLPFILEPTTFVLDYCSFPWGDQVQMILCVMWLCSLFEAQDTCCPVHAQWLVFGGCLVLWCKLLCAPKRALEVELGSDALETGRRIKPQLGQDNLSPCHHQD